VSYYLAALIIRLSLWREQIAVWWEQW